MTSSRDLPNSGIKPRSPALTVDNYQLNPEGSPRMLEWVAYHFPRESSQPQNSNQGPLHCVCVCVYVYVYINYFAVHLKLTHTVN